MIPAKYFFDREGHLARITRVGLIPTNVDNSEFYSIGLAYPDNSTNNAFIRDNLDGTYAIVVEKENDEKIGKMEAIRFVGDTMYYADDTEHIPQEDVISIDVEHISKLIESITILGSAMENTIASVHSLFNPQK